MNFKNHWFARYAFALTAVVAASVLREGLIRLTGGSLPTYITFYPAVMLSAVIGGVGPGLLATAAAALGTDYFVLPPIGSFGIASLSDAVGLAFFTGMGVFMSVVAELYRRAQQKAAAYETEAVSPEQTEPPARWTRQGVLLNAGLAVALGILATAGWQAVRSLRAVAAADQGVTHTRAVIQALDSLVSMLKDEETGQRGYLLTGEDKYLEPYQTAVGLVQSNLAGLKQLTQDNTAQRQRLALIEALIVAKEGELKESIALRRSQGLPAALEVMMTDKGKDIMDQIRKAVTDGRGEEELLLQQRADIKNTDAGKTLQALLAGGVLAFLLLITLFVFLRQENVRAAKAEADVRHHRDHLQEIVAARMEEIARANENLKQEIDEHQQAKDALREQREWLRVTLTSIGDAVLATDTEGRVTFLNPVAESLTGWREKEVLGEPVQSVFHIINEQTRAPGEDIVARVLREGRVVALANHSALVGRDGREIPIEDSAAPIKDDSGAMHGVVLVFHDVGRKRRAEDALRESEQRLRSLGDNLPGGAIYQHLQQPDGSGCYAYMSAGIEKLAGMTAEQVMADAGAFRRLIVEEDLPRCAAAEAKSAREMTTFECEFRQRTVAGEVKWVHCRATPRRLENGAILWDGVVSDITERKRVEEALRESRERLDLALVSARMATFDWDIVNNKRIWSEGVHSLLGTKPETFTGEADEFFRILPLEDRSVVQAALARAVQTNGVYETEYRAIWPDGSIHAIAARGKVHFDTSGRPVLMTGVCWDITERKQAGEATQAALDRFYLALSNMTFAAILVDDEDRIEFVNQAFCDMYQLKESPAELQTLTSRQMLERIRPAYLNPDEELAHITGIVERGLLVQDEEVSMRGGRTFLRDHIPIRLRDKGRGRLWIQKDITERKQAERRTALLAEAASRLLNSDDPQSVMKEVCGKVLEFLDCQVFLNFLVDEKEERLRLNAWGGIPASEAAKIEWLDYGVGLCGCAARDRACVVAGNIQETSDPRTKLVKRYGIEACAAHPLMVAGVLLGTLCFGTRTRKDFTEEELSLMKAVGDLVATAIERKRAQTALQMTAEEVKRSNRDLEQFAYIASHDLQEPLRAVGGYVKLLQHRFPSNVDAKALEYINGAVEGATRMERLISDLLAYSRVGTRRGDLSPMNLDGVLDTALRNLHSLIMSTEAKVTRDALPTVAVDGTQIMQIFQNLIGNAIKFRSERPPEIHVGAQKQTGRCVFSVRDNGIGIEPQYFERIFQIFQRLHSRRHYPGTGIGLAICKKMVERHGGEIWVESEPGKGSTFFFTLPENTAMTQSNV
jgi:PAS domain S-box-containing protein